MKTGSFLILTCTLILSCSGEENTAAQQESYIEIDNIPIIENEILFDLIEGEKFELGDPVELKVLPNGEFLVFDQSTIKLHHFTKHGSYIHTIAGNGRGPGEVENSASVLNVNNDTLYIQPHTFKLRRDLYVRQQGATSFSYVKSFEFKKSKRIYMQRVPHQKNGSYSTFMTFQELTNPSREIYERRYTSHIDHFGNVVADSLYKLKTALPLMGKDTNGMPSFQDFVGYIPYRYQDSIIPFGDDKYLLARADSSKLYLYNNQHELVSTIGIPLKKRPITEADLDFILKERTKEQRRRMSPYIDDYKPPFLRVWTSNQNIWLHTDDTEKGKEFLILDLKGKIVGKTYLGSHDHIWGIIDNRLYTLHRDRDELYSVRIYEVRFLATGI